jgi:hypothetical protein
MKFLVRRSRAPDFVRRTVTLLGVKGPLEGGIAVADGPDRQGVKTPRD